MWSGITGTDVSDFYREGLPLLYVGSETRGERTGSLPWKTTQESSRVVFLVDRQPEGPARILTVSVGSGEVSVVPGTEYAFRSPGDTLAVVGKDPTYLAFVRSPDAGGSDARGTRGDICFIDLREARPVGSATWNWAGEFPVERLLPLPDGRYLLPSSTLINIQEIRAGHANEGRTLTESAIAQERQTSSLAEYFR